MSELAYTDMAEYLAHIDHHVMLATTEGAKPWRDRDHKLQRRHKQAARGLTRDVVKMWLREHGVENGNVYIDGSSPAAIGVWNSKGAITGRPWLNKLVVRRNGMVRASRCTTDKNYMYMLPDSPLHKFPEFVKELCERIRAGVHPDRRGRDDIF